MRAHSVPVPAVVGLLLAANPASAHDWYSDLWSPSGERCCTSRDCRPVDHRYDRETGRLELGIEGVWVPVDPDKLVSIPSTDGSAHACYKRRWSEEGKKIAPLIRCVILPGEA